MDSKAKRKFDDEVDPTPIAKHKKVIGPSLPPPAATDPSISDSGSDSDDDFGPSLPPSGPLTGSTTAGPDAPSMARASSVTETETENQRDQWMLHPPTQSDWASKIDPTQLRNRRFNTGKSATASKKMDSSWVESPEERMKRLQDAVMGVGTSTAQSGEHADNTELKKARIKQYNVMLSPLACLFPLSHFLTICFYFRIQIGKTFIANRCKPRRMMTTQVRVHSIARRTWLSLERYLMHNAGRWLRRLQIMTPVLQKGASCS